MPVLGFALHCRLFIRNQTTPSSMNSVAAVSRKLFLVWTNWLTGYGEVCVHSAIRAQFNQLVTRETPTHEYATIATWSRAD
jgi:hypothetical protein